MRRRVAPDVASAGQQFEYGALNKNQPFTVYPRSKPPRWLPFERSALRQLVPSFGGTLFDGYDLIVDAGASAAQFTP
jgi:hypothetical protein